MLTIATILSLQLLQATIPASGQLPMLHISNVTQIDNLDRGTPLGKNRADFYANVTINGTLTKTEKFSSDNGNPDWKVMLDTTKRVNTITIALWDDDGGLDGSDDHADINYRTTSKDITFTYDRYTGKVRGDVRGFFNEVFQTEGKDDDYKARINFRITK